MSKIVNSVFLVCGTAIGSGLISLPLSAAKVGIQWTCLIIVLSLLVAYKTSCLTIDLIKSQGQSLSIVELSDNISGKIAKLISMFSLYALSLALLCAYFAGTRSILESFFDLNNNTSTFICVAMFSILFIMKPNVFNNLNSLLVSILLILIACAVCSMTATTTLCVDNINWSFKTIMPFLPIIFTSFGVQNVCPFVAKTIGLDDIKSIKKAFFIGLLITAVIYAVWIYATLARIYVYDNALYQNILNGGVDVGMLVNSLCNSANFKFVAVVLKLLSLFAIVTSATGTGIGLISSLKEIKYCNNKYTIILCVIGIPTMLTMLVQNAFLRILSFGGMIATTFVIFMPVYLNLKISNKCISGALCVIFGIFVVIAELLY